MKNRYILLVEDNADDELLILRAFKRSGFDVEFKVVRDGVEGLEFLVGSEVTQTGNLPCLVLLDLSLPRMTGLELLKRLRELAHTRALPVVILTSSKEDEDIKRAYELGANSYVTKPIDFGALEQTIKQLGSYWLLLNQPLPALYSRSGGN